MIEYYAQLKWLHIAAVTLSGSLFLVRGIGVQAGAAFAMLRPVRFASYAIDTVLLIAALSLVWILGQAAWGSTWLWVKLALLPIYIVLGTFALKRASSRRAKLMFFIAALAVFVSMVRIATTHDPLGGLARAGRMNPSLSAVVDSR